MIRDVRARIRAKELPGEMVVGYFEFSIPGFPFLDMAHWTHAKAD
jgi:hypothetical protein